MNAKRVFSTLLVLAALVSGTVYAFAADAVPPPPPPLTAAQAQPPAPALPGAQATPAAPAGEITPARVSYLHGEVSFWRPGASDWSPATVNTPMRAHKRGS